MQIAGLSNWSAGNTRGIHIAGLSNWNGGNSYGAQVGGLLNWTGGDSHSLAIGGLANWSGGSARGIYIAGLANVSGSRMDGMQISGTVNAAAGDVHGAQISGVLNTSAGNLRGLQLSLVNIGGDVRGAQVGLLNIASKVRGTQVGLLNIAEDMRGVPLGLLSLVDNGYRVAEVFTSDIAPINVAFKGGSKDFYTMASVGSDEDVFLGGFGLGMHTQRSSYYFDIDAMAHSLIRHDLTQADYDLLAQLRFQLGSSINEDLAVFGGLSASFLMAFEPEVVPLHGVSLLGDKLYEGENLVMRLSPGLFAGIAL